MATTDTLTTLSLHAAALGVAERNLKAVASAADAAMMAFWSGGRTASLKEALEAARAAEAEAYAAASAARRAAYAAASRFIRQEKPR